MDTAEYLIHEGYGIEVYAVVSYTIADASGDGWNEPHEAAHVELGKITLHKRTRRVTTERKVTGDGYNYIWVYDITDLGEAPAWVDDIIAADEDWQSDLLANDGPDPDRAYDEARDDALMGGR
jgi:hypothetical protein